MTKSYLRTERGERIDHPDFQHAAEISQRDAVTQVIDGLMVGAQPIQVNDQVQNYIVQGFDASVAAGTQVTIFGGTAILSFREAGVPQPGCVLTGGPASKTIDMLNFNDGIYGAYVRFNFREENFLNRLFWNALAVPPVEVPRSIPTRKAESWDLLIEQTPPGSEWLKVATLTKVGAVVTDTDARDLFFEGRNSDDFQVPDSQWGSVADRLASRGTAGIFGFRRFIRAVQRQFQEIIHGGFLSPGEGWWDDPTSGFTSGTGPRSLSQLNDEKFGRSGQQTLQGDIIPDTANAYDLGNALANRFALGYIQFLTVGDGVTPGAGGVGPELFTSNAFCGTEFNPFETAAFANSLLSGSPGDSAKVLGGYLTVNTNVAGGAGNPPTLEMNDTPVAGGQADSHIARIVTTYSPAAGKGFLDIRAGIFANEGDRSIRLAGTGVMLAKTCGGQNGLAYANRSSMLGFAISMTGAVTILSVSFAGDSFTSGDAVIELVPNLDFMNVMGINNIVMGQHRIAGGNLVEIAFAHTFDPPVGGSLLLTAASELDIVVLRR
jgi:hypothetical protein